MERFWEEKRKNLTVTEITVVLRPWRTVTNKSIEMTYNNEYFITVATETDDSRWVSIDVFSVALVTSTVIPRIHSVLDCSIVNLGPRVSYECCLFAVIILFKYCNGLIGL